MEYDNNGQDEPPGSHYSRQPRPIVPPTVLVTELDSGALVLQGRPDGPRVYLSPTDAVSLKREVAAAFGNSHLTAANDDQAQVR